MHEHYPAEAVRANASSGHRAADSRPTVFLLTGLTGSGKTTFSRRVLEPQGATRLSVDELVHQRHGRYGVDYPEYEYFERQAPVLVEVRERLAELIGQGRDVVVDHGLWRIADRAEWKKLVLDAGGRWRLLYFPVERPELLRRLAERNLREDANALTVSEEALNDFYARFDPPQGEGEEIVPAGTF